MKATKFVRMLISIEFACITDYRRTEVCLSFTVLENCLLTIFLAFLTV